MASKTEIANIALTHMGGKLISDIEEASDAARTLNAMYEPIRKATLRMHPWNFAIKQANLAALTTLPLHTWGKAFPIPSDFIRMVSTQYQEPFAIENNLILSDEPATLPITYVYDVVDTAHFDDLFVEAFALRLAITTVERITQSNAKKGSLERDLQLVLQRAKTVDGSEDDRKPSPIDPWITIQR